MRIDLITLFPEYFSPLTLSLIGKAEQNDVLDISIRDLRDFTHDLHRTVDDTPYGGGAGMVMKPEPIGEALDALLAERGEKPILIVPSPTGALFTQKAAEELAGSARLIFLCGRYEGIDARIFEHYDQRPEIEVREYSIGDYVLMGGEVAALAMIEAITRLIPGVVGNPASLTEESHTSGLLEHPVYTKPETWRDLQVPPVLLSGHHAAITAWRAEQALARTRERRPDLLD
jgi:tRNA (guanine37-N1)-methyltransferase